MSSYVRNVAIESEMVENVGVAIRISLIFHAVLTTQCTSGLLITVLTSGSPVISNNARNIVIESEMVENVGIVVCISLISHSVPEMQCTSGFPSSVSTSGSPVLYGNVRICRQCCNYV